MENILIEKQDNFAVVTINRPTKLNALNKATIEELHEAFTALNTDNSTKVIILTGSGEKAFVAGADISEFADFSAAEGAQLAAKGQELLFDFNDDTLPGKIEDAITNALEQWLPYVTIEQITNVLVNQMHFLVLRVA